jgi:hypothetical protein
MNALLRRLERLEQERAEANVTMPRTVVQFIKSDGDGHAIPFDSSFAYPAYGSERITRETDESGEDFEARALGIFPGSVVCMGG